MDLMDFQAYPRNMGNKSTHALKLQQHLYDQMSSQSEFCDVTLLVGDVVSFIYLFTPKYILLALLSP